MAEQRERAPSLRRRVSLVSLSVAFAMIVIKFWAWLATGSVAMLTSALDALIDAAAALATFVGVRYAQQPPDWHYRWGHGKAEAIAVLMQPLFLGRRIRVTEGAALSHRGTRRDAGERYRRPSGRPRGKICSPACISVKGR